MVCFSDKNGLIFKRDGFDYSCEDIDNYYFSWEQDGLNEIKSEQNKVFPNPFKDKISLKLDISSSETEVSINIYSHNGILLRKFVITEQGQFVKTFNLSDLKSGLYLISINGSQGKSLFYRIIKE